jgi:hypothetical protein
VTLQTYHSSLATRWTLLPRLPKENVGLVTVYNENGVASLSVFRSVFERLAPTTLPKVEKLALPAKIGQGTSIYSVSDELLEALTEAYQEAAGR